MIFVSLGTNKFPFNRLIKQIDLLVENKIINDKVYAQIGNSTYIPRHLDYCNFLSPKEYEDKIKKSRIVITHGGTGAIVKALRMQKQVIAVPRKVKYGEHLDDHQMQVVNYFSENGYVWKVDNIVDLEDIIKSTYYKPIKKKYRSEKRILKIIDDYIRMHLIV